MKSRTKDNLASDKTSETMARLRRSAVYVASRETVGHDLIFRHYTNKVVVGRYVEIKTKSFSGQQGTSKKQNNSKQ